MCGGKVPKVQPRSEPLKTVDQSMSKASSDAARRLQMQQGLASVWTRYNAGGGSGAAAGTAGQADKLGG